MNSMCYIYLFILPIYYLFYLFSSILHTHSCTALLSLSLTHYLYRISIDGLFEVFLFLSCLLICCLFCVSVHIYIIFSSHVILFFFILSSPFYLQIDCILDLISHNSNITYIWSQFTPITFELEEGRRGEEL